MAKRGPYKWFWLLTWDNALRRLWRRSDARVAAELSLAFAPEAFSPKQVHHRRKVLGLPHGRPPHHAALLAVARGARLRLHQHRRGWGHLIEGYPLSWMEVDILCVLRDNPLGMTRPEISAALGRRVLRCGKRRAGCLRRLTGWGLVRCPRLVVGRFGRRLRLYELAGPAKVLQAPNADCEWGVS